MAWLQVDPSGNFHLSFRFGGRKYKRSLRTKKERDALARQVRVEENIGLINSGRLSIPPDADIPTFLLSDGRLEKPIAAPSEVSLEKVFARFFDELTEGSLEPNTVAMMRIHTRHLKRVFGSRRLMKTLNAAAIQEYVSKRAKDKGKHSKKLSPTTIKKELTTLRSVWKWATKSGLLEVDFPNSDLRFPKESEKPPFQTYGEIQEILKRKNHSASEQAELWECLFLTLPEIDELLRHVQVAANHAFIYPMFVFAAHTGARRSEMMRSQVNDINVDTGVAIIREKKRVQGKDSRRTVPLSATAANVMREWLTRHPGGESTFCLEPRVPRSKKQTDEPRSLTPDEAHHHFERTLQNSKWSCVRGWHVFRHSFCSNCAAAGVDQRLINAWVGHQTEEMVRRYRHLIPDQQQAAIAGVFG